MIKKLPYLLIAFCCSFILLSCQKELYFKDVIIKTPGTSDGTAVYSFLQANGTCSAAIVNGSYNKNSPLTASNSVVIKVKADSIGTYAIATANINGILFGGSGSFTSTGEQTITLIGTGTPLASGPFTFTPGSKGCSFTIAFSSNPTNDDNAQFTLNGAPDSCTTAVVSGSYVLGTTVDSSCSVTIKATVITPGSYTIATNAVNGVIFTGSGKFLTVGQQSIILKASGRPDNIGTYVFTPGTNGCQFSINCTLE